MPDCELYDHNKPIFVAPNVKDIMLIPDVVCYTIVQVQPERLHVLLNYRTQLIVYVILSSYWVQIYEIVLKFKRISLFFF